MGLDSVELVMDIEHEFGLRIPNKEAERLAVLGDMHSYIVRALQGRGERVDPDDIWRRMTALLVTSYGVDPASITRSAHIVSDLGID
jgi:acyl carrier protein